MNAFDTTSLHSSHDQLLGELLHHLQGKAVPQEELVELLDLANHDKAVLRRLAIRKRFGEPNAYLRGYVMMMNRRFQIDRRSYIPDAYAEELVERVIQDAPQGARCLEIGTGCGWMSITLKKERPDLQVTACDIDPNVLALARDNATAHGAEITFRESYFVADVPDPAPDLILANVPYGGDANYTERELEERPQMPPIALFDPAGPAAPIIDFVASVRQRQWSSRIYVETGYLDRVRLDPVVEGVRHFEHLRNGEFGYLVIDT